MNFDNIEPSWWTEPEDDDHCTCGDCDDCPPGPGSGYDQ